MGKKHKHEFDLKGGGNHFDFMEEDATLLVYVECKGCGLKATEIYELKDVMLANGSMLDKKAYKRGLNES